MSGNGNGYLKAADLLRMADSRVKAVDLPGDLGRVYIRSITEGERSRMEMATLDDKGDYSRERAKLTKGRLIVLCVCDPEGNRLFKDEESKKVMELDSVVTSAIFDACVAHCGIGKTDIERLAKN